MKNIFLIFLSFSSLLCGITTEEKVGSIIMCPIHGNEITDEIKDFLKKVKPGGIILYGWANDLTNEKKLPTFIQALQEESIKNTGFPLFIGIDEEGGRVDRLQRGFPSARAIGDSENTLNAFKAGDKIGHALKKLGINLNFAPVVDINSNPNNQVIRDRSFGDNVKKVSSFATAFVEGHSKYKVFHCLKHFPGHGDVSADSHYALPVSHKSLEELLEMELIPYKEVPTNFIMTAHILFPKVDPDNPATLSKIWLQGILRGRLGYKGIIITDSLRMKGILSKDLNEIAVDAFNAGNDILLIGGDKLVEEDSGFNLQQITSLHEHLVKAVKNGSISLDRLDESLERIHSIKKILNNP